jgi:predicted transcriptional regulator
MPELTITLTSEEMEHLRKEADANGETPDSIASTAVREFLARANDAWCSELAAALAEIYRRLPPDVSPEETEADITAAAAEARELRHAARRP